MYCNLQTAKHQKKQEVKEEISQKYIFVNDFYVQPNLQILSNLII